MECSAVKEAASAADCVLVTYQQLCAPGFPLDPFTSSVEYAPEAVPDVEAAKAAATLLGGQRDLRQIYPPSPSHHHHFCLSPASCKLT